MLKEKRFLSVFLAFIMIVLLTCSVYISAATVPLEGFEGYADDEDLQIRTTDFWFRSAESSGEISLETSIVHTGTKALRLDVDTTKGWSTFVGSYPWNGGGPKFEIPDQKGIAFWASSEHPYLLKFSVMGPDVIFGGKYIALKSGWHQYYTNLETIKSYYPDKFGKFTSKSCQGVEFIFLGDLTINHVKNTVYIDDIAYVDSKPAGSFEITAATMEELVVTSSSSSSQSQSTASSSNPVSSSSQSKSSSSQSQTSTSQSVAVSSGSSMNSSEPQSEVSTSGMSEDASASVSESSSGNDISDDSSESVESGSVESDSNSEAPEKADSNNLLIGLIIGAVILIGGGTAFYFLKMRK